MKKASFVIEPYFQKNRFFDENDKTRNRDNALYFARRLRQSLREKGYDLQTDDIHSPHESDLSIYFEVPKNSALFPLEKNKAKSWLTLYESDLIRPDNWDIKNHERFGKVFTWNDSFVQRAPDRYVKSNFAYVIPDSPTANPFSKRKLCTLIAGNKSVRHPLELYSARRNYIRWAEKHIPNDFDYYGIRWEHSYLNGGFIHKVLRRTHLLKFLPEHPSPNYRGTISEKNPILSQYKFSICFENGRDISGYVTEKIFDSMFAGCVPVYWGASNITDLIPENCFIDFRRFLNERDPFAAATAHLQSISETRWNQYQRDIQTYMQSSRIDSYSADHWAEMFVSYVETL